jgi:hypothetical protein
MSKVNYSPELFDIVKDLTRISNSVIFEKDEKRYIFEVNSKDDFYKRIDEGYSFIGRCKMLVLLRDNPSIVWNYLK